LVQRDGKDIAWQIIQGFVWFRLKFSSSKIILYHPVNNFFFNFYLGPGEGTFAPSTPDRGCAAASLARQSKTNSSLLPPQTPLILGGGGRERCVVVDFVSEIEVFRAKFCVTCRLTFGWPCRMFLTLDLTATREEMRVAGFSVWRKDRHVAMLGALTVAGSLLEADVYWHVKWCQLDRIAFRLSAIWLKQKYLTLYRALVQLCTTSNHIKIYLYPFGTRIWHLNFSTTCM
jgi:hypothetical protein